MKKITLILFLFTIFVNAQTGAYQNGDVVDDFTVTDINGVEHNLYSITAQGKYVWLDFFFVDCVPCQSTAAIFNEFYDKYGCNEGDVYCLSINLGNDDDDYVAWYEQQFGGNFNHAPASSGDGGSGAVTTNFGVQAFPTYCLIGTDNTMIQRDIWPLTNGIEALENTFPQGFTPAVIECSLGLEDIVSFDFSIYPSVSNGEINIDLPHSTESSVVVLNTVGQIVFQDKFLTKNINLRLQLAQGIYLVKVTADKNTVTKRIIIK